MEFIPVSPKRRNRLSWTKDIYKEKGNEINCKIFIFIFLLECIELQCLNRVNTVANRAMKIMTGLNWVTS